MTVATNCSICNKSLGGKEMRSETRVGIFEPVVDSTGQVSHFAMGENRLALCKSCTQSLYSWIKNRRKKTMGQFIYKKLNIGPGDCACVDEQLNKN